MSKNKINERLSELQREKNDVPPTNGGLVPKLLHQQEEQTDLSAIAEELKKRHEAEAVGENEGYIKDTIYIRADLYKAFQALCLKRGDKKKHANAAYEQYILNEYKKIKRS